MRIPTLILAAAFGALNSGDCDAQEFHGYPCTRDCSGHEAGYAWAERHGITDPDDCSGNSQSFIEGCEAYAEENQDEAVEECDEDDSDDCDY